jgi:ribosomal protein L37AE/L43A
MNSDGGLDFVPAVFVMIELNDFYNAGFGWICRHCEGELTGPGTAVVDHSRIFREGEAESKVPELASPALAKWTDKTRRSLTCPRCGVTEPVDIS